MVRKHNYIELTPREVVSIRPDLVKYLPPDVFTDSRYIVRIDFSGCIEFGFPDDDWFIK